MAKSKPTAMKTTSTVSTSSSSVNHPFASKCLGILKASAKKPDARARINSQPNPASRSQGRLKDAYLGGLMVEVAVTPAATDKSQKPWDFLNLHHGAITRKKCHGYLLHPEVQKIHGILKLQAEKRPHHFHVSSSCTSHGESLFDRTTNFWPKSNGSLE